MTVLLCRQCKKAFRKDINQYEESDEYCPHCDNHYVGRLSSPLCSSLFPGGWAPGGWEGSEISQGSLFEEGGCTLIVLGLLCSYPLRCPDVKFGFVSYYGSTVRAGFDHYATYGLPPHDTWKCASLSTPSPGDLCRTMETCRNGENRSSRPRPRRPY